MGNRWSEPIKTPEGQKRVWPMWVDKVVLRDDPEGIRPRLRYYTTSQPQHRTNKGKTYRSVVEQFNHQARAGSNARIVIVLCMDASYGTPTTTTTTMSFSSQESSPSIHISSVITIYSS